MSRSYTANGNIKPYRFVRMDTTADFKVLAATDGSSSHGTENIGISQPGTRKPPLSPLDDGYAAIAGEEILVWEENDECLLITGAAVTNGDNLKSDSDGRGITGSVSGNYIGAVAMQTATAANQLIKVKVTVRRKIP